MSKKAFIDAILISWAVILLVTQFNWRARDFWVELKFKFFNPNAVVEQQEKIDSILGQFSTIPYDQLDDDYLEYTKSNRSKYKQMLQNATYYEVPRDAFNQFIVGRTRIKDYLCKDKYYKNAILGKQKTVYWLIDKKLLYKTLELQQTLAKLGYNPNGFKVISAHREPRYNEKIRGAGKSKHVLGQAVDARTRDVNKDGRVNQKDKQILLNLLDKKIIKNQGGIGKYPGTRSIHYDVRGSRARWDDF